MGAPYPRGLSVADASTGDLKRPKLWSVAFAHVRLLAGKKAVFDVPGGAHSLDRSHTSVLPPFPRLGFLKTLGLLHDSLHRLTHIKALGLRREARRKSDASQSAGSKMVVALRSRSVIIQNCVPARSW